MAVFLAPIINTQQEDANGAPLVGGTISVYLAGTSTPVTTYSDKAGLTANSFPITLNTLGLNAQGAIWLTGGVAYKFVIKDAGGVSLRTIDNVSGTNDTAVTTDQWIVYQGTPTFVGATSFTIPGDQTQTFQVGRRVKTANTGGTTYSTITGSVYSAPNTTITVRNDSGVLDSGLSVVSYGVLSVSDTSLPGGLINYGQCLLSKSGANLLLSPLNGNRITINGAICVIPAAGVTLAPTSLTPGTNYNIYAYMNAGVLALEASTTGHSVDATTGIEIKTGDPTRAIVGKARIITGPAWVDTDAQRLVVSWFNRRPRRIYTNNAVAQNSTTSAIVALAPIMEVVTWGDAIQAIFIAEVSNSAGNSLTSTGLGLNTSSAYSHPKSNYQAYTAAANGCASGGTTFLPGEGYAFISLNGSVSAGTGTWASGLEASGVIQG